MQLSLASLVTFRPPMIEWIPVIGSRRIIAQAYDPRIETIYVRFRNGRGVVVRGLFSACLGGI